MRESLQYFTSLVSSQLLLFWAISQNLFKLIHDSFILYDKLPLLPAHKKVAFFTLRPLRTLPSSSLIPLLAELVLQAKTPIGISVPGQASMSTQQTPPTQNTTTCTLLLPQNYPRFLRLTISLLCVEVVPSLRIC